MDVNAIGTSGKMFKDAKVKSFNQISKITDGVHQHRIIAGPMLVETIYYPVVVEQDGKFVQSVRSIVRPEDGCIIDSIARLDEEVTKKAMLEEGVSEDEIKKYRSSLRPSRTYRFLVFDRDEDGAGTPTVRVFDYAFSVKTALEKLQATQNKREPNFLEFGLLFMYDVYITRSKKEGQKNDMYATEYSVTPELDSLKKLKEKIPVSWLNWTPDSGEACPYNLEDYFTDDELQAIQDYPQDLTELCVADTPQQIAEKLKKNPIYLEAKHIWGGKKNTSMFPVLTVDTAVAQLEAFAEEVLLLQPPSEVGEPEKKSRKIVAPKKEEAQEAEIVDEQVPVEEEPKKPSLKISKPAAAPAAKPVAPVAKPVAPASAVAPKKKIWGAK